MSTITGKQQEPLQRTFWNDNYMFVIKDTNNDNKLDMILRFDLKTKKQDAIRSLEQNFATEPTSATETQNLFSSTYLRAWNANEALNKVAQDIRNSTPAPIVTHSSHAPVPLSDRAWNWVKSWF